MVQYYCECPDQAVVASELKDINTLLTPEEVTRRRDHAQWRLTELLQRHGLVAEVEVTTQIASRGQKLDDVLARYTPCLYCFLRIHVAPWRLWLWRHWPVRSR